MDVHVARQPILDRLQRTYGYELLFRDSLENVFRGEDPDLATASVIDTSFFVIGLEALTGGRPAFVNFTRAMLVGGYPSILPSRLLVVEILEGVPADPEVLAVCRDLKAHGYLIALDDVVGSTLPEAFLGLADIAKVDFTQTTVDEQRKIALALARHGIAPLAEKVETEEDFTRAAADGYRYFQGYFFARPKVVSGRAIPAAKMNVLQLLKEVHRPDPDRTVIENLIKHEVSLTLKLLTHLRAAAWGLRRTVESVRHALLMLGDKGMRQWASVVAIAMLGDNRPSELVVASVTRASLCEGLMTELGLPDHSQDAFFTGLFSMIDALLGLPLCEAVERLPVSDNVRDALLGVDGLLARVCKLAVAWERGAWEDVAAGARALGLRDEALATRYQTAVQFASCLAPPPPAQSAALERT